MQTIILAGFVVLLALLLFFLYLEKEEDTEQMIVERTKTEAETVKAKGGDKKVGEMRAKESEAETSELEILESKENEQRSQVEGLEGMGETYQSLLNSSGIKCIASSASQDP
jgi:hypothetical protein